MEAILGAFPREQYCGHLCNNRLRTVMVVVYGERVKGNAEIALYKLYRDGLI